MKGEIIVLISFKENLCIILKNFIYIPLNLLFPITPFCTRLAWKKRQRYGLNLSNQKISLKRFYLVISTYYAFKKCCVYI